MKNNLLRLSYLLVLAAGIIVACGKKEAKKEAAIVADEVVPVRVVSVTQASSSEPIRASGLLASETEARLSFKTGGVIQKIYVKEGDKVSKGQLLAMLNLTEINAQVQQANESVQKAERDLKRITNLYRDSVATLEQVQNLTTALNVAKNNFEIAQYNKSFSEIRATTSGVVIKKIMNEGELAGPGNPVLVINATGRQDWVVKVGVSDKDWARLREGNRAEVKIDAFPGKTFTANVKNLSVIPDVTSGLYQIELSLAGAEPSRMATGLFGQAVIYPSVTTQQPFKSVPIDAVIEGNGDDAFVYVPAGNKAKRVPIKVAYINNSKVFITSGLEEVGEVIVDGSAYLTDGTEIKIVK
ncbi:MAG: efflux RND transporter periplasmic adaptor subunit [Spirosomataceae bacterium]